MLPKPNVILGISVKLGPLMLRPQLKACICQSPVWYIVWPAGSDDIGHM